MITSPADPRLSVDPASPAQVVRDLDAAPMKALGDGIWSAVWDADENADGLHELTVKAKTSDGQTGRDAPVRSTADYENAFGAWPEKQILGTQLGPNENGHGWPPRRERIAR